MATLCKATTNGSPQPSLWSCACSNFKLSPGAELLHLLRGGCCVEEVHFWERGLWAPPSLSSPSLMSPDPVLLFRGITMPEIWGGRNDWGTGGRRKGRGRNGAPFTLAETLSQVLPLDSNLATQR